MKNKEMVENKMKNDIKSSISIELNKISVNIKFKRRVESFRCLRVESFV